MKKWGDNIYEFEDCGTARTTKSHVNRLYPFWPWSDEILSTSQELDDERPWTVGGSVDSGSLFVIGLAEDEWPFGVGQRLAGGTDDRMEFQWISNKTGNTKGRHLAGWLNGNGEVYWANKKRNRRDSKYTGRDSGTRVNTAQVILHNFELTTEGQRIPAAVMRAIMASGETG